MLLNASLLMVDVRIAVPAASQCQIQQLLFADDAALSRSLLTLSIAFGVKVICPRMILSKLAQFRIIYLD